MDGLPKRKSNRLPQFDYGTVGAYFITICSREKAKIFGRVVGGRGVKTTPPPPTQCLFLIDTEKSLFNNIITNVSLHDALPISRPSASLTIENNNAATGTFDAVVRNILAPYGLKEILVQS